MSETPQTPMRTVSFRGLISRDLFVRAQKLNLGRVWPSVLILPAVMTGTALFNAFGSNSSPATLLVLIAISLLMSVWMYWWFHRQWDKVFRNSPYLREPFAATLSEEGLHSVSEHSDTRLPWNQFTKVRRRADLLLLYRGPALFQILSRTFFNSQEAWEEAVAMVDAFLGAEPRVHRG